MEFSYDKYSGYPSAYGTLKITFKLDCGVSSKFSKKLDSIIPTAVFTLTAGFRSIKPASGCWSFNFPYGAFTLSGSGVVTVGNSKLGMSMGLYGDAFVGVLCDESFQRPGWSSKTIRVGFRLFVRGTVSVAGQTADKSFTVEPSEDTSCTSSSKESEVFPNGQGYLDSKGVMWKVVDSKKGTCV